MTDWQDVVDTAALGAWMDRRGLGAGPLEDVTVLTGGTQNVLLRFTRAGRAYVLRRPPKHLRDNSNDTMRREARMLGALADTNVPHPRLIAACPEQDVLGAAFYLMEPVDGFNATVALPHLHASDPAIRHKMGLSLVDAVAKLGAVDYRAIGLGDFGKPDKYLERQVARWGAQLKSYGDMPGWPGPESIPGVDKVADWLDAQRPAHFDAGIIHGDYHLANVMYRNDGPDIAAIVDWELTAIGDPLIDLGWLLATWPDAYTPDDKVGVKPWDGFPTADELVGRYAASSARDLSRIDWYMVLACYKLGILLEGTHARACAGKAPKETGDMLHEATVSLFERALRKIG